MNATGLAGPGNRWRAILAFVLLLLPVQLQAAAPLLSWFKFDGNGLDDLGNSPEMYFYGVSFTNNTLFLPDSMSRAADARIPGLSYNSFTVAVEFYSLNLEWPHFNILTGGPSYRWIGFHTYGDHRLYIAVNNWGRVYAFTNIITTNSWHSLFCSVDIPSQRIMTFLDGQRLPDWMLGGSFQFEVIGSAYEQVDKLFAFNCLGDGSLFYGCVDNLRVYSRALTAEEIMHELPAGLSIQRFDQTIIVHWSARLKGYALEYTTSLATPRWCIDSRVPATLGDESVIIDLASSGPRFYRLRHL